MSEVYAKNVKITDDLNGRGKGNLVGFDCPGNCFLESKENFLENGCFRSRVEQELLLTVAQSALQPHTFLLVS